MSNQVNIKWDNGILSLGPRENDYIHVKFETEDIQAHIKPYLYTDEQDLILYFKSLANEWRGWIGVKTWKSIEGDLQFDAEYDNLGYVNFKILLIKNHGSENHWNLRGKFRVELGALENFANEVSSIFETIKTYKN